tara:strand:- start:406 stop:690 length:285 start_codon:yes stop_codon:yes gene_type:complete
MNLPDNFPHSAPEGYDYETKILKKGIVSIWLNHHYNYLYSDESVSTIWGFYDVKKGEYFSPINHKKVGKVVKIQNTTPYTAMQLNLKGLEHFFV